MSAAAFLRRNARALLAGAVGAIGGAAYAHFIGCHTGGCAITGNTFTAGLFFGFAGLVIGAPGPRPPPRTAAPPPGDVRPEGS